MLSGEASNFRNLQVPSLTASRISILGTKKYRPPRPMGAKGGCSPQNNVENWGGSNRAWENWQQQFAGTYPFSGRSLQSNRVIM
jgi:hypothetical protein